MKGIYQLLLFVILSAAKDLGAPRVRSFAALRMTLDEAKDDKQAFSSLKKLRQIFIISLYSIQFSVYNLMKVWKLSVYLSVRYVQRFK